jgi:hypothetical protein
MFLKNEVNSEMIKAHAKKRFMMSYHIVESIAIMLNNIVSVLMLRWHQEKINHKTKINLKRPTV